MSVSGIPVQSGGVVVLTAAAAKAGANALRGLPSTGARAAAEVGQHLQAAAVIGTAMIAAGAAVLIRRKRVELSAGEDLTSGPS